MSLPKYDQRRKCPQCGAVDSFAFLSEPGPIKTAGHPQEHHLDVTCNVCGNLRFEQVTDGKPALGGDSPKAGPDLLLGEQLNIDDKPKTSKE